MPDLAETIRGMSPAALRIYKQQLPLRLKTMSPQAQTTILSRLQGIPELTDVLGARPTEPVAQPTTAQVAPQEPQREYKPWEIPEELPFWQKGLAALFMPFTLAHEYAIKPLAATVHSAWTPEIEDTEGMGWLEREKAEYEAWEAPWGVKFWTETLPWFAIPGIGTATGAGRGIAGMMARVAPRLGRAAPLIKGAAKVLEYSPYGLMEKAPTAALRMAGKGVGRVAGRVTRKAMPDLQDIGVAIETAVKPDKLRQLANIKGFRHLAKYIGGESAIANKPAELAVTGQRILRAEAALKATGVMAPLNALGTSARVFGLDDLQRITSGQLKGLSLDDVMRTPRQYWGKMTKPQQDWATRLMSIEDDVAPFLERHNIKINKKIWNEGERWSSRSVVGKVNPEGELAEYAFVTAGGRPGIKPGFMKTRVFATMEEAQKQGFRYLPKEEAVALNVQKAYNRVADQQMSDWLLARVPWRTTATPAEVRIASSLASVKLRQANHLKAAINRALRGEELPAQTIRSIERNFPEINIRASLGKRDLLTVLRGKANDFISERQGIARAAKLVSKQAREKAIRPAYEEAMLPQVPVFMGKVFTGSEATETVRFLRQAFTPSFNRALGAVNKANSVGRVMALAGDVSPFGIQLIFLAGSHPKIYGKSMGAFVRAMVDPDYLSKFYANHQGTLLKSRGLMLSRGAGGLELTQAYARGGLLTFGPLKPIGKLLAPFQRGYEAALDTAGILLRESYEHLCTTPSRTAAVEAFVNEFRGLLSTARIGMSSGQRQLEAVAILAPQYNRAIGALLKDVASGGLRGQLARDNMAKGTMAIMAMTVAVSMAMGESPDEIADHLNPTNPNFMTWDIAGQRIGPGSKVRSLLYMLGKTIRNPEDAAYNAGRFLRGNFSPVLGTSMDLITGKDYAGDPTRDGLLSLTKTVVGENMLPIWVQSVVFEGGDLPGRLTRGMSEFVGGRAYPLGAYGEMRALQDKLAQEQYGMMWADLTTVKGPGKVAQMRIEGESPELQELITKAAEESGKWARGDGVLWNDYNKRVDQVQDSIKQAIGLAASEFDATGDGRNFREKVSEIYTAQRMMFEDLKNDPQFSAIKEFFEQPLDESLQSKMNPNDLAYKQYNNLMYGSDMVDEYGNYRFDEADVRRQSFIAKYGTGVLDYIEELLDIRRQDEPPAMQALREARVTLNPYWEIENRIWAQYPVQLKQIALQIMILERTDPKAAKQLQFRYPQVLVVRRQIALLRKQMKQQNPMMAESLRLFYS